MGKACSKAKTLSATLPGRWPAVRRVPRTSVEIWVLTLIQSTIGKSTVGSCMQEALTTIDWQHVGLVVAAAGSSRRFGAADKLLLELDGSALFCHCIRTFSQRICPENIVVVIDWQHAAVFRAAAAAAGLAPDIQFVAGGQRRQDSVGNGLQALPAAVTLVAVQDAARPRTSLALLEACVASAQACGSGVAARPLADTIKHADAAGNVVQTLDRCCLFAAETPQVFDRAVLQHAYAQLQHNAVDVTDDAQAVEMLGLPVTLVKHTGINQKITFPGDLS